MTFDRHSPALKAPQQAALRQVLAELSAPAEPGELDVEAAVLASFRSRVPPAAAAGRHSLPRRSLRRRFAPHARGLAAGLAAITIVAGGAAAAYAGVLPAPLQNFAHRVFDAPASPHPAAHHPGGGTPLPPGTTPARAVSPTKAPHSASPGPAHTHPQPRRAGHPSPPAHPAWPSARPSPHPDRSSHPVPPSQASQPASRSHSPGPPSGDSHTQQSSHAPE